MKTKTFFENRGHAFVKNARILTFESYFWD